MFFHKSNIIVETLLPKATYRKPNSEKTIYLTFDDGPIPEVTEYVLETLRDYQAKATFFCIGKNIKENPKIFQKILAQNHSIGNHTQNHVNGWKTDTNNYLKDFKDCQETIASAQVQTSLFRPPYGRIGYAQARYIRTTHVIVMWDVLSGDFSKDISPEKCLKKSIQHTENGSIVVFHDSQKAYRNMAYTLPRFLDFFAGKGYSFEKL
jgi:peptidoglycan-N-acetylglucosamine deacetylase